MEDEQDPHLRLLMSTGPKSDSKSEEARKGYFFTSRRDGSFRAFWHTPQRLKELTGVSEVNFELCLNWRYRLCQLSLAVGEEPAFGLSFYVPWLFGLHVGVEHRAAFRLMERFGTTGDTGSKYEDRELSLSFRPFFSPYGEDSPMLRWNLWTDPNCWVNTRPRWRYGSFDLYDFLLGRAAYSSVEAEESRSTLYMPEGEYPVTVKFEDATWKRPRWPWSASMRRADVTPDFPVPIPAKGESSYDQDEDAIHDISVGGDCRTAEEAVEALRESVMRTRSKRESANWRPEKGPYGTLSRADG
jgi:hypothetical protein